LKQLDEILRGEATSLSSLERGQIEMPVGGLAIVVVVLGAIAGLCTGSFAVFRTAWSGAGVTQDSLMQLIASGVKLPLLFFLTFLVTFPSLYVFNAIMGSRLSLVSVWRLVLAMLGVMLSVLASLGPIVVFFGASTQSYAFMKLFNVAVASVAGGLGLAFLMRTLHRLVVVQDGRTCEAAPRSADAANGGDASEPDKETHTAEENKTGAADSNVGALDRIGPTPPKALVVFQIWVVVFGVVGAQMSWVLRPFVGSPDMPFSWFRTRESNFFVDVVGSLVELLGG
jgi:hypothetical protein